MIIKSRQPTLSAEKFWKPELVEFLSQKLKNENMNVNNSAFFIFESRVF